MTGKKQSQYTSGLALLAPFWEEIHRALGWIVVQALFFVQPLLRGWGEGTDMALDRAIRWLEGDVPAEEKP
ncbi:MAG: hypothetical protein RMK65_05160 [Anaerolineae bacterium]|nr:hypothetical protein [Anaerolineae bacterium]MCX8066956.1 hypothetical protein [Anaerolineae bacterium]MDW7991522.1 hypothetical protein [Anaerolineae bacterium]